MSWEQQQEDWRQQYAARGLPVPPQPAKAPYQPRPVDQVARAFAGQLVGTAIPAPAFRFARPLFRPIANFFAPRNVGAHHTLYGRGLDTITAPPWNSSRVAPSGLHGRTAGDQIPGMSYYWDAGGRGGSAAAANQVQGQTAQIFGRQALEPGTQGVGKVVTAPRLGPRPDANLPNSRAMMVDRSQPLRVTGEVAARSGPFTQEYTTLLQMQIQRQKLIEAARSASRVGAAGGATYGANNVDMQALREFLR